MCAFGVAWKVSRFSYQKVTDFLSAFRGLFSYRFASLKNSRLLLGVLFDDRRSCSLFVLQRFSFRFLSCGLKSKRRFTFIRYIILCFSVFSFPEWKLSFAHDAILSWYTFYAFSRFLLSVFLHLAINAGLIEAKKKRTKWSIGKMKFVWDWEKKLQTRA